MSDVSDQADSLGESVEASRNGSRRRFLRRAGMIAGGVALTTVGYTFGYEPYALELVEQTLSLPNLPPPWRGRRILQLSDLHAGRTPEVYLRWAMRRASRGGADLIVVTGDFMSCAGTENIPATLRVLDELTAPSLGIYACLGNHDYGAAWANVSVADSLVAALGSRGIRVLRNETANVDGLAITGLEDLWCPNWTHSGARNALASARRGIALCHNPDACDLPIWQGYEGQVLAGHTHGGQCKPPFLPPPLLPVNNRRYVAGAYNISPNLNLYINRATGNLRPVRFNCRPEITMFTLADA